MASGWVSARKFASEKGLSMKKVYARAGWPHGTVWKKHPGLGLQFNLDGYDKWVSSLESAPEEKKVSSSTFTFKAKGVGKQSSKSPMLTDFFKQAN